MEYMPNPVSDLKAVMVAIRTISTMAVFFMVIKFLDFIFLVNFIDNTNLLAFGVKMSATNKDAISEKITVNGSDFINWPINPGVNIIGKNAANVVKVDEATAGAI